MTSAIPPRFRVVPGDVRSVFGFNVTLSEDDLNRLMRRRSPTRLSAPSLRLLERMKAESESLIRPRGLYGFFPVKGEVTAWFPGAELIALAAVTLGPDLEERVEVLSGAGDAAASFLLDVLGSAWTEGAVEAVDEVIGEEARMMGYDRSRRRSPGYHPWPLESQPHILKMLGASRIGIHLTSGYMMIPRKSVTFGVKLHRSS